MKEYKARVLFAYHGLEGEGDTEEKEKADLLKKQKRFAKRLVDALHGEAWDACQELLRDPEKLKVAKGYELVFKALGSIEKETIIRKTEAFESFFDQSYRRKGQSVDAYLREKKQAWRELKDLDDATSMSDDLQAYFMLRGCNLSRDDRRSILLANKSSYDMSGIEQSLRISYHDIHEKERSRGDDRSPKKKGYGKGKRYYAHVAEDDSWWEDEDWTTTEYGETEYADEVYDDAASWYDDANQLKEDEAGQEPSDQGASDDEAIHEAYATMDRMRKSYKDQRKKLKDLQKARGFFKGEFTMEERKQAIEQEKSRSRCGACGRVGHWAGDAICPRASPKPSKSKGKGKSKSGKGKKGSANVVSTTPFPTYFSLTQSDLPEYANMVRADDDEEAAMPVDGGDDGRRRRLQLPRPRDADDSSWEGVSVVSGYQVVGSPDAPFRASDVAPAQLQEVDLLQARGIEVHHVPLAAEERVEPRLNLMRVAQLQELCVTNKVAYSGLNKQGLVDRLQQFYAGQPVPQRGSAKHFVRMTALEDEPVADQGPVLPKTAMSSVGTKSKALAKPKAMQHQWHVKEGPKMIGPHGRFTGDDEDDVFMEGIPIYHMLCDVCQAPMVGRKNRVDGGKFYGCSMLQQFCPRWMSVHFDLPRRERPFSEVL